MLLCGMYSTAVGIKFPLNMLDKKHYTDCQQLKKAGYNESGMYYLWKNSTTPYKVRCDMKDIKAEAVPILILQRAFGNETFNRGWHDYVIGFGQIHADYWAGLNRIYYLTSTGYNVLTVHMQDWNGNSFSLRYNHFKLMNSLDYTLSVSGCSQPSYDDLSYGNGAGFTTPDKDKTYCAGRQQAGWWFQPQWCAFALPTGQYYQGGHYTPTTMMYNGVYWSHWRGYDYSLRFISFILSTI